MSENESTGASTAPTQDAPMTDAEKAAFVRSTRRFDLRRILGALFVLYGVICLIVGLVDPAGDTAKTGGIQINLWTGVGMLVAGILFFVWDHFAPVPAEDILGNVENEERIKAAGEGTDLA